MAGRNSVVEALLAENKPAAVQAVIPDTVSAAMETLQRQATRITLDGLLAEAKLSGPAKDRIREKVGDQIMSEAAIKEIVTDYVALTEAITPDRFTSDPTTLMFRPLAEVGPETVDKVQAALDDFFGNPNPEMKGKYPKITSIREFYIGLTGDPQVTGKIARGSMMAEALPGSSHVVGGGTITMSNLFGTSMNRALMAAYDGQERWWEPIVSKTSLGNMKQQDRIRLHNFGSLTERTTDGAEYTELDWNETAENYTPTEYGNVVTVGRPAIINDDLSGIRQIPTLLAQSATITINEYVSALFTANSGNGPALADTYQVFNAANHQGNRVTTALTRNNLIDAMKVIMKMTNQASKRLSLLPKYLLHPIDLVGTAWELTQTPNDPESANNTRNIVGVGSPYGLTPIKVPNWTDTNNWYLMCDPAQIACIEMGFLFGNEQPELLSQENPSVGMVFTNDVIAYKVRWDFGGDWIDYRGAVGAIVA